MYTLKSIARRGTNLSAAIALAVGAVIPAVVPSGQAFADALNPLTERSLTLSSSSPGWAYTDGSGNNTYAPPNSGANGQKTGNYFSFKVSTDSTSSGTDEPIKAMSFQYCTQPAGKCQAPGNDDEATIPGSDDASHSDLNVNYDTTAHTAGDDGTEAQEIGDTDADGTSTDFATVFDATNGVVKAVPGYTNHNPKYSGSGDPAEAAKDVKGTYMVVYKNPGDTSWTQSTGWTVTTSNQEEASTGTTGKQNTIILQNTAGLPLPAEAQVKVFFFANNTNYITNPGEGAFFVKINTFKNFTALDDTPGSENTLADNVASGDVIDGGVTVANVMNQSIQITTKVLETMQFSVGTVDPDTLSNAQLGDADPDNATPGSPEEHKPCDTIKTAFKVGDPENVLQLGNQDSESSLASDETYATHSYWRLSSNSSAGATVYYSGHTLSNTSGDEIAPIGTTAKVSAQGSEQFGLAMATKNVSGPDSSGTWDDATYGVDYSVAPNNTENGADNAAAGLVQTTPGVDTSLWTDLGATNDSGTPPVWDYSTLNKSYHSPRLDPLVPTGNSSTGLNYYGGGSGSITNNGTAKFAFDPMSDTVPAPIASENNQVVDCVTAKMRYIANIAATTPAGIYTTKINYIAAPQY